MSNALHVNQVLSIGDRDVAVFDLEDRAALPFWITAKDLASRWKVDVHPVETDDFAPDYSPDDLLTEAARNRRKSRLDVIAPIVQPDEKGDMPILRDDARGQMILEAAASTGTAKDKIYQWLRLWWRHGQIDNALLPNYKECGRGPAQPGRRSAGAS